MCLRSRGGFSLIGLLVVVLIIGILVGGYFVIGTDRRSSNSVRELNQAPGGDYVAQTVPGKALERARGVDCQNNLRQLRAAIDLDTQAEEGKRPAQLDPGWHVPLQCPQSGRPYRYDPATGQVSCLTPGHEAF